MKSADMQLRLDERDEASGRFVDACNAYKKVAPQGKKLPLRTIAPKSII
jgi:hypothetical protein